MRARKTAAAIFAAVLMFAASVFGLTALTASDGFTVTKASDLFEKNSAFTMREDEQFPEGTAVSDDRKGLFVSTTKDDSTLNFRRSMSGVFDLDLRVFSKTTGVTDLQKLVVTVTDDATGRSFDTVFNQPKEQETWGTGEASVLVEGANTGAAYLTGDGDGADADGVMRGRELKGSLYHTTSFNNVTEQWFNDPLQMIFDPERMEVRVMTQHNWYRIMDLDDEELVKQAGGTEIYPTFERYSVSLRFAKLSVPGSKQHPAEMILYSVNGQSLAGKTITDAAGPNLFAAARHNGVKGMPFQIPDPIVYDLVDGMLPYEGTVEATDSNGAPVSVADGVFMPDAAGVYTLHYSAAEDAAGNAGSEFSVLMRVLEERPEFELSIGTGIEDCTVAPGTELVIPGASAPDLLAVLANSKLPVTLKIIRDAETALTVEDCFEDRTYLFSAAGTYTVRYSATDNAGVTEKREFTVVVTEKAPFFTIPQFPVTLSRDTALTIPDCTAKVGDVPVAVESTLIYPDGRETRENSATLDMVGRYTVCYSAESNGVTYVCKKSFQVAMVAENLFVDERGCEIVGNTDSPDYSYPSNGVRITATKSNSTVRYANTIDVSKNTKKDVLIELLVTPPQVGTYEFSSLCVTLTDVYDADNTLKIYVNRCIFEGYYMLSLVRAGARGNTPRGWEWGVLQETTTKGTNMTSGYYGVPVVSGEKMETGKLYYDNETKKVFVSYRGEALECIDLDSAKDVGAGNEWTGFTTGEVTLTVTASDLSNTTASYMILNVNGQSMSGEYITNEKEPEFRVNYEGNASVPKGLAGSAYPVFRCDVTDEVSGSLAYSTEVYRDYGTPAQKKYGVADGAFLPDEAGSYTILYSAFGKVHAVTVIVLDALEPFTFAFGNGGIPETLSVGEFVDLSEKISAGGSGDALKIKTELIRKADGEERELTEKRYRFEKQGGYEIVVTVEDYLGRSATFRYPVKATYSETPILTQDPVIPKAIVNDRVTVLPKLSALDYFSDKTAPGETAVEITVTEPGGGTVTIGDDRVYQPKLSAPGTVSVCYRAYARFDRTKYLEKIYEVAVIEPVYKSDYFYTESELQTADEADHASFTTLEDGAAMTFANALPAGVGIVFRVSPENAGFNRLDMHLTDSENSDIQVLLSFMNREGATEFYINNTLVPGASMVKWGDEAYQTLQLNSLNGKITNAVGVRIAEITDTVFGKEFTSFPSGKVYFEIAYRGVEVSAGMDIRSLCGQIFNTSMRDNIGPEITVFGSFPKSAKINEVVTVPFARAVDVLDPYTEITVTVRGPGGVEIYTNAEIAEGMDFVASLYGGYNISYVAKDSSDNVSRRIFYFTVKDRVPPTLLFYGVMPASGKVNEEIVLPRVEVSDNNDTDLRLYIHYTDPYAKMRTVTDNKFTPAFAGTYVVTYYSEDSSNSYVILNYEITVS